MPWISRSGIEKENQQLSFQKGSSVAVGQKRSMSIAPAISASHERRADRAGEYPAGEALVGVEERSADRAIERAVEQDQRPRLLLRRRNAPQRRERPGGDEFIGDDLRRHI